MTRPNQLSSATAITTGLENILEPGETILWAARPNVGRYVRQGPWYLIPFSVVWFGFTIFWELSALKSGAPAFFLLWGLMFMGFGAYFTVGRFFVMARQARLALYAVTNRRVLIVGGTFRAKLTEMRLSALPPVRVDQDLSGVGTITFGSSLRNEVWARAGIPSSGEPTPAFIAIDRPSEVARLIETAGTVEAS